MNIIAQLFGIGATVSLFLIYQQKTRKGMLAAKLSADIFWVIHYLLLGGYAGAIPNGVGILREVIFIQRKKKRWASCFIFPVIFICINLTLGIFSYKEPYDLLPIIASAAVTLSLWIDRPRMTKIISIPVSLAFMVYDLFVLSYVGVVNEAIAICSIIIYFAKEKKNVHK